MESVGSEGSRIVRGELSYYLQNRITRLETDGMVRDMPSMTHQTSGVV